jgi:molecular chaperone GrpE
MSPRRKSKKVEEKIENRGAEPAPETEFATQEPGEPADAVELKDAEQETVAPPPEQVIETLSNELEELEDRHLRLVAEYDNFRKRTVRERIQQTERAQADLVRSLLESLDDLARVSEHGSADHDATAILEGIQLVETKLLRALEQAGMKHIEAVGKTFNPEVHDALVAVSTDEPDEDDVIAHEIGKGYSFKGILLRPSLVQVMKYQPEAASDGSEVGEREDES